MADSNSSSSSGSNSTELDEEDLTINLNLKQGRTPYAFLKILGKLKHLDFFFQNGVIMVVDTDNNTLEKAVLKVYSVKTLQFKLIDFKGPTIRLAGIDDLVGDWLVEFDPDDDDELLSADDIAESSPFCVNMNWARFISWMKASKMFWSG